MHVGRNGFVPKCQRNKLKDFAKGNFKLYQEFFYLREISGFDQYLRPSKCVFVGF